VKLVISKLLVRHKKPGGCPHECVFPKSPRGSHIRAGVATRDMPKGSDLRASPGNEDTSLIKVATDVDIIEWLAGDESHDLDAAGLVAGIASCLRDAGLPLDRLIVHLRTIHPEIAGRTLVWEPGLEVQVRNREHVELAAAFARSPLPHVADARAPIHVRLDEHSRPMWSQVDAFKAPDLVEFIILPLRNARGLVSITALCTKSPEGFSLAQRKTLERIVPALRNACELCSWRTGALSLLDTYVGTGSAQLILAGKIRRGESESLNAALLLCDLRGFTKMSNALPSQRVVELLDAYFDCVVPAISDSGGEVIKYMGDAVLAFFHHESATDACIAALDGALSALKKLRQFTAPDAELHAGIALHYGEVSYGNIGSGHRLDFTLIGPDVNLVSRIQTVCSTTGQPVIMSERFATLLGPSRATTMGSHNLKGFSTPVLLYAHDAGDQGR
jgi:adenylate cyclase